MSKKTENSARFGRKTASAVSALLSSRTLEQAAQVADIPPSTLRRWRSRPEFARQLCEAQAEILQGTINELRGVGCDAAQTLGEIVRNSEEPAPSRVRAAIAVIGLLLKAHESDVVEKRLVAIEAALKHRAKGKSYE
jgi:hypothetical protein